ncbi:MULTISPECIES: hypothetical protein [Paenibacillus]|uniref:Uncharacterized protein n=1 Tax=Paenibacillus kribbensis TaxID=172713 RepID=A0A222WNT7_9BACL|nr:MULTISPECIES: hypothetical protein [Paenibacillus]ASR47632.1 hypothetical protein B4V02_13595 [Paenibacillus kribbensis]MEC0236406.1 hypothetical protein [Paenibacillus kribbensis]
MNEQNIDNHLREALTHLESALNQSVRCVLENDSTKKEIGLKWEQFLGEFMGQIREKGKKSRLNLLGWISFPRIR